MTEVAQHGRGVQAHGGKAEPAGSHGHPGEVRGGGGTLDSRLRAALVVAAPPFTSAPLQGRAQEVLAQLSAEVEGLAVLWSLVSRRAGRSVRRRGHFVPVAAGPRRRGVAAELGEDLRAQRGGRLLLPVGGLLLLVGRRRAAVTYGMDQGILGVCGRERKRNKRGT